LKNSTIRYALFLSLILFILSCEKNSTSEPHPLSHIGFFQCHNSLEWNEQSIKDSLIGLWKFEFKACYDPKGRGVYTHDQEISMEIREDDSIYVRQFGIIIDSASFSIIGLDGYQINTEPGIGYVLGSILFCEDRVVFNASHFDLCDHYFIKN